MYLACIGIIFPAVYYLFAWLQKVSKQAVALVTGGVVAAALLAMTFVRNDIWLSDLNFFNAISDADPNSAMAQYSIGALYMRVGDFADAEQHMSMAVAIDPNSYKAWYNTGVLYLRERKPAQSLDALNRCLALREYPKAYFSRALLYQGMGKPELAIPDIDKVLEDQPQNARAYFIKADCLEQEAKMPEAIDYYSKAIQYDGTDPLFYERRGMVYGRTRQNAEAISDLDKAVDMNPGNGEALYYRGVIKYHSGQEPCNDLKAALDHGYKQAAEAIEKACKH
jgi:tetratricopeptide (TPR) repeat protein